MAQSVPGPRPFVDPFASAAQLYPPVTRLRQLATEPRPPDCTCPRMVQADRWVRVWHLEGCTEVLSEALEAIL